VATPNKQKRKKESLILGTLLTKLGREIGATVLVEPEWGVVGQITFKGGRKSYFRYNTLDLNPVGASDIAKDKDYAAFFMKKMGYPTPRSKSFCSPDWAQAIGSKSDTGAALRFAKIIGYPVIVKPNSGSQGVGVSLVHSAKELQRALKQVFKSDKIALVQQPVRGRDYRIVVLDNKIISAYERIALSVTGDGRSTVAQLLKKKQRHFIAFKRDTLIKSDDPRIRAKLRVQGLRMNSILEANRIVYLLDNANLSTGGDAVDVTNEMHTSFKQMAIALTRDMGLRLCGVDIITADITIPGKFCVLEINAGPGLDHYVKNGPAQQKMVEDMYRTVLRSLAKRSAR
jgi:D-alanine-D-alanine ligase-like ATP-grasp enzyme